MAHLQPDIEEHMLLSPYDLISLHDARVPAGAFAMRPLDLAHVQQLAESNPETWPEIVVTLSTAGYIVVDGYHRWEAAKIKQIERIKATCRAYASEQDLIEAAFQANLKHGLKTSVQTKGDYAYWLHVTFEEMSQEEIARRATMTQGAVSKAIKKRDEQTKRMLEQQEEIEQIDPKAAHKAAKRSCQHFTKNAMRFLEEVKTLSDEQLARLFTAQVKTQEDKEKLVRIGRLLSGEEPLAKGTTGMLRLHQFVSRPG